MEENLISIVTSETQQFSNKEISREENYIFVAFVFEKFHSFCVRFSYGK